MSWTVNPHYDDTGKPLCVWSVGRDVTERNRAAREVARASILNEQLIESMPGVFYLFDDSLRFQRWNRNLETVTGYSGAELAGMSPLELFDEEEGKRVAERIAEVFVKGHASVKAEFLAKDGSRHPFAFTGLLVVLDGRNCLVGQGIDIRDERRLDMFRRLRERISEIFLQEDDALFPSVLDVMLEETHSRFGMFGYVDDDGAMVYPSITAEVWEACRTEYKAVRFPRESWGGIWGRSLEERRTLLKNDPLPVPEGHIPITNTVTTPVLFGETVVGHIQVANKETGYDDEDVALLEYAAAFIGPVLNAWLRQKRAEEELQRDRDQMAVLFENTEDRVYVADPETDALLFANSAAVASFGDDAPAGKCYHLLYNRDVRCPDCRNDAIFGERQGSLSVREQQNETTGRWYRCRGKAIRWSDGKWVRFEVATDITDEKALARERIRLEKFSALGRLVAGVAHELNNPLMGVLNYAQYCRSETPEDDERYSILGDIEKETRRCVRIVGSLLSASRVDDGVAGPVCRFDPAEVVESVVRLLEYRTGQEGVTVVVAAESGSPVGLSRNREAFQQVVMNLLSNAIDAVEESDAKEVTVTLTNRDDTLLLEIADSGCGIPDAALDRICDPFFTTKAPGKGTGLGLATCWKIVKSQGGLMSHSPRPGGGTVVSVRFPHAKE